MVRVPELAEQHRIAGILDTVDDTIRYTHDLVAKLGLLHRGLLADLMSSGLDDSGTVRDSGQDAFRESSIGLIPSTWSVAPLGSVVRRLTDGTHQAVTVCSQTDETVPFLYVSCVRDGEIFWDKAASIDRRTYAAISKGREPTAGMTLYTAVGSYGHAALVEIECDFGFQRHIACIYPDESAVEPAFLAYWLDSPTMKRHADRVALGNAQRTVTLADLARYPVPIPPLDEQREIARRLRAVAARGDAERQLLRKLELLRIGLSHDLLRGEVCVGDRTAEAA